MFAVPNIYLAAAGLERSREVIDHELVGGRQVITLFGYASIIGQNQANVNQGFMALKRIK